jgi:hypothetical protein
VAGYQTAQKQEQRYWNMLRKVHEREYTEFSKTGLGNINTAPQDIGIFSNVRIPVTSEMLLHQ